MWHTPKGDRTLAGAEAELVRAAIEQLFDDSVVAEGSVEDWEVGVAAFDRLTCEQRLVLLADVGDALLGEDVPAPKLRSLNEAVVGAIFETIFEQVQIEIDDEEEAAAEFRCRWRQLVLAATEAAEKGIVRAGEEPLPAPDCPDFDCHWSPMIEALTDGLLWDQDYEDEDFFVDAPPEKASWMKKRFNIDPDYFMAVPPDPTEPEVEAAKGRLRRLVGREGGTPDYDSRK